MPSSITKIQTISVGSGGSSSIAFNNIPQTYTDLIIKFSGRPSNATTTAMVWVYNSSVTVANAYNNLRLYGTDNSVSTDTFGVDYLLNNMMTRGDSTSNTFGNGEIYIPNYTRNGFGKIASSDGTGVGDNSFRMLNINYWTGTDPITSITLLPFGSIGTFVQHTVATLYGVTKYAEASNGSKASGGTVTTAGGYTYHTFFSSGMFTPSTSITGAEVLVVAGGGASGHAISGGGGAGGLVYASSQSFSSGVGYAAIVGAGGGNTAAYANVGCNGTNSVFASGTVAIGGGGGGGAGVSGANGGSGGGGDATGAGLAGSATAGQGNAGARGASSYGGGGGGAGGAGVLGGTNTRGGDGGIGVSTYSAWGSATGTGQRIGSTFWYAGGGGGSPWNGVSANTNGGIGGNGGGGFGGDSGVGRAAESSGLPNTGGGAGGGNTGGSQSGGSGIVIIRYTT